MEVFIKWFVGLFVSLVLGNILTGSLVKVLRKRIDFEPPKYKRISNRILGTVEGLFFTIVIAFKLPGGVIAMIAWIAAKMAAHWNSKTEKETPNIEAVRFTALLGGLTSMFFAIIGGLIINGEIDMNWLIELIL